MEVKLGKQMLIQVWDEKETVIINKRGKVIVQPEDHGFNGVPFVRLAYEENDALGCKPPIGHAFMFDIVMGALGLLEWTSMLAEAGHLHLDLKVIANKKTIENVKRDGIGNATWIEEAPTPEGMVGSTAGTRYMDTPSTEIDVLDRIVHERKIEELTETARLRNPQDVRVQSGVAKIIDMIPEDGVISEISQFMVDSEIRIIGCLASFQDKEPTIEVKYPTIVDAKSITAATSEAQSVKTAIKSGDLPSSKTGDEMLSVRLYRKALPDLTDGEYKTIEAEIKAAKIIDPAMAGGSASQDMTTQGKTVDLLSSVTA
jgi:hypothetical protein